MPLRAHPGEREEGGQQQGPREALPVHPRWVRHTVGHCAPDPPVGQCFTQITFPSKLSTVKFKYRASQKKRGLVK